MCVPKILLICASEAKELTSESKIPAVNISDKTCFVELNAVCNVASEEDKIYETAVFFLFKSVAFKRFESSSFFVSFVVFSFFIFSI